jgi:hypothetical protein
MLVFVVDIALGFNKLVQRPMEWTVLKLATDEIVWIEGELIELLVFIPE